MSAQHTRLFFLSICAIFPLLISHACLPAAKNQVVVYTSVDQIYSEPILKRFENETGVRVLPVFDVEAAKTTGLINRLIAEKDYPKADLFWSGEFVQTLLLKERGLLEPYAAKSARCQASGYCDPEGYWHGFACRARILLVNTHLVSPERYPKSIFDFLDSSRPAAEMGIANPLFGTSATHAAAVYAAMGVEKGGEYFRKLQMRGVRVLDGNSVVRDFVARGQLSFGLTDTDDACVALSSGAPVTALFPDQDGLGTLVIPNTVALIAGSRHRPEAQRLMDFLLSQNVERELILSGWTHVPYAPTDLMPRCFQTSGIKKMSPSMLEIYRALSFSGKDMRALFMK